MNFEMPCDIYARLSAIPMLLNPEDTRKYFKSIYLERARNQLFAIVTNGKLAAIERIGDSEGPDERTAIVVDPVLIKQCENEIPFNSSLLIVPNSMLNFTAIKTRFGYQYTGNAMVQLPEKNWFSSWREWGPDEMPTATEGAMYWNVDAIYALACASPTGSICFPKFIDTSKPIVVRDHQNTDWFGLFMPTVEGDEFVEPASVPDWAR